MYNFKLENLLIYDLNRTLSCESGSDAYVISATWNKFVFL